MRSGVFGGARGGLLAPVAAVGSFLAALSCCLPVGYFLGALGLAGTGAVAGRSRLYLMGLSFLLLGFGFVRAYGGRQCQTRRSRAAVILLWTAAALVLTLFLFPHLIAGFLADHL